MKAGQSPLDLICMQGLDFHGIYRGCSGPRVLLFLTHEYILQSFLQSSAICELPVTIKESLRSHAFSLFSTVRPTYPKLLYERIYQFHESPAAQWDKALDLGCGSGKRDARSVQYAACIMRNEQDKQRRFLLNDFRKRLASILPLA